MKNIHMLKKETCHCAKNIKRLWTGEMTQWVKDFATKPDNLDLVPGTHMVEEEK